MKNHSRNLHAPLCGIFCPNSVAVARYGALIRTKSPTNCDAHLAESLFQTRSRKIYNPKVFTNYICKQLCSTVNSEIVAVQHQIHIFGTSWLLTKCGDQFADAVVCRFKSRSIRRVFKVFQNVADGSGSTIGKSVLVQIKFRGMVISAGT